MTIVLPEYENWEDVDLNLTRSKANALLFSPYSKITSTSTRLDVLNERLPELQNFRYGDLIKTSKYPDLRMVIQISHKTIPGTEKFKVLLNT